MKWPVTWPLSQSEEEFHEPGLFRPWWLPGSNTDIWEKRVGELEYETRTTGGFISSALLHGAPGWHGAAFHHEFTPPFPKSPQVQAWPVLTTLPSCGQDHALQDFSAGNSECRWDGENAHWWAARELKPPSVATQTRREYQHVWTQEKNTNPGRLTVFGAGEEKHSNVTVGGQIHPYGCYCETLGPNEGGFAGHVKLSESILLKIIPLSQDSFVYS